MRRWNQTEVARLLEETLGNVDPEDPKGKKRLRILNAATALFLKHGYRKTAVAEVAREAGVAKGTVYLYFETKVELVIAAIALEKRAYLDRMRELFESDLDPRERLRRYIVLCLVLVREMPLTSRLFAGDDDWLGLLAELPANFADEQQAHGLDFVEEMVEDCVGTERWNQIERQDRAKVLMGITMCAGVLGHEQVRGGLSLERYATVLAEMVVDGLVGRVGSRSEEGEKR